MTASTTYTLPPINAGDIFTCQGDGLLYENIARTPVDELRRLLADGSGQVLAGNRKESKKWFQAQCAHYGLPTKGITANLRTQLEAFLQPETARVPDAISQLEAEKNEEYKKINEEIKNMTSRARSPTPGRTRRVTMSHTPSSQRTPSPTRAAEHSSVKTPRSRKVSVGPPSQARTGSTEPEIPHEPAKRGRGRPRKSEPAPMGDRTNTVTTDIKPSNSRKKVTIEAKPPSRPVPPSQDSTISTYSELDEEAMEVLDEIENGIEMMEQDGDGDSQMDPPPSPPHRSNMVPEPQTPKRTQQADASSPFGRSPRTGLERDVVSGTWSLNVVGPNVQPGQSRPSLKGSMNLHLAEDKRSIMGEFSLLGMDGVLQSRTLEGRIDGAYARLAFVGQVTIANSQEGEPTNRVFGPSSSQSGYLRFSDGRKGTDGTFTLKGSLSGGNCSKVDFEGVREGEEQDFLASWDDFVD